MIKYIILIGMISLVTAVTSQAVPEKSYYVNYFSKAEPYYHGVDDEHFTGKDNVSIAFKRFEIKEENNAIIIVVGQGETLTKYGELVYDLRNSGYSIYLVGHRGQGESERVDKCTIQYVRDFNDYVDDLETFINLIVKQQKHSKIFMLGHSMGAAVATLYAAGHPHVFDAMVLASPMFDMNTPPYPKHIAYALARAMVAVGLGKVVGGKNTLQLTSSVLRSKINEQVHRDAAQVNGKKISFGWAKAALDGIASIEDINYLPMPMLMLQAAMDLHVPSRGQNAFCEKFSSCRIVRFARSYHEILMEKDGIRDAAIMEILAFLSRATTTATEKS